MRANLDPWLGTRTGASPNAGEPDALPACPQSGLPGFGLNSRTELTGQRGVRFDLPEPPYGAGGERASCHGGGASCAVAPG
jgi:hypothetical protein